MADKELREHLIVYVGLPGSGKSYHRGRNLFVQDFHVYSTDDIMEEFARDAGISYSEVFNSENYAKAERLANERLAKARERGVKFVIWDQTNLAVRKRKRILEQFPNAHKLCYVMLPPATKALQKRMDDCMKEREQTGKKIPYDVMENMKARFTLPTLSEGFDRINYVKAFEY